jgi:hypothetical protein
MKNKVAWLLVLIIVVAAMQLPSWAAAQGGGTDGAPDAGDTLAPYRDWLWGVLSQGLRVTGGTECRTVDGAHVCKYDFTLSLAETE